MSQSIYAWDWSVWRLEFESISGEPTIKLDLIINAGDVPTTPQIREAYIKKTANKSDITLSNAEARLRKMELICVSPYVLDEILPHESDQQTP